MSNKVKKLSIRNTEKQNREETIRCMERAENLQSLRESVKRNFNGADIMNKEAFPFHDRGFSVKAMKEKLMRESLASTGFPQLLRAGVQMALNSLISTAPETAFEKIAHVISSDKDTELYAPLHGISFLSERGPGMKFNEAQVAGLDIKLTNREFGEILAIDQNLLDDDQTGQLQQLVGEMAEWSILAKEVYCTGKLNSVSGQSYAGLSVPQSETKPSYESNYPWTLASAPFRGGGYNKPATFTVLNQAGITAGIQALLTQKNLLGLIMNVSADGLVISPYNRFTAMVLMQSTLNPSSSSTQTADIGKTGSIESINPIKSILNIVESRYLFDNSGVASGLSKAWYIIDQKKPWFILQDRQAPSVVMENPESGESFNRKIERHRLDMRFNADIIDPRFAWQGNDGSV